MNKYPFTREKNLEILTRTKPTKNLGLFKCAFLSVPITLLASCINIHQPNLPPTITSDPVTSVKIGQNYSYDVEAVDPEGDPLYHRLNEGPPWMYMNPETGLITSVETVPLELGYHHVEVEVSDLFGSDSQSYDLLVEE